MVLDDCRGNRAVVEPLADHSGIAGVLVQEPDRPALVLLLGPDSPAVDIARHNQFLASWNFILVGVTMVMTDQPERPPR